MNNTRAKGCRKNPLPSAYFCFPLWVYHITFKIALSFPLSCPQLKVGLSEHEVLARWTHQWAERKRCYCIVCNINVHMFNNSLIVITFEMLLVFHIDLLWKSEDNLLEFVFSSYSVQSVIFHCVSGNPTQISRLTFSGVSCRCAKYVVLS